MGIWNGGFCASLSRSPLTIAHTHRLQELLNDTPPYSDLATDMLIINSIISGNVPKQSSNLTKRDAAMRMLLEKTWMKSPRDRPNMVVVSRTLVSE